MKKNTVLKTVELLSPAKNKEIAKEAILHGADAIYIGPPSFGARKNVANSLDDIAETVDFAHKFRSKVYATVNTIIYENELTTVKNLCHDLYKIGVDALIIQDMALLRMNLPPIALHASTQCFINTPEKAVFFEKMGFSQLVLARELSLKEIKNIVDVVNIPVECFIHGALCVSYSGRCHAGCALKSRSANRGECPQICRLPFTLIDSKDKILAKNKYLLSLKDLNAGNHLKDLIEIGVRSFKIEGRLKDMDYVKNNTAFYNRQINNIIANNPDLNLQRSSYGDSIINFSPDPYKSFNRGFTDFFLDGKKKAMASIHTPKSLGQPVEDRKTLNNGDGVSYFDNDLNYVGGYVNKIIGDKIITSDQKVVPERKLIYKTFDKNFIKLIQKPTAKRKIKISVVLDTSGLSATDEMGNFIKIPLNFEPLETEKEFDYAAELNKLGETIFVAESVKIDLNGKKFIPKSVLSKLRREMVSQLIFANIVTYPFELRKPEDLSVPYISNQLDYKDNVSNSLAKKFYREHGVSKTETALECGESRQKKDKVIMTCRYCILNELGVCKKEKKSNFAFPLYILNGNNKLRIDFDCKNCEMKVLL